MEKNLTYYALLEACNQPGCPLCRLIAKSVQRYLENLLYENVNDGLIRRNLRRSLGFCNLHAWQIIEGGVGSALGIAIIYHDVLSNLLQDLPDSDNKISQRNFLDRLFGRIPKSLRDKVRRVSWVISPKEACPACIQQEKSTKLIVSVLVNSFLDEKLAEYLAISDGLCLPHLDRAINQVKDERTYSSLISLNRKKYSTLNQELSEIIRKSDYRFQGEGFGVEGNAWRRAIAMAAGGERLGEIR